jgi:predicted RNA-binding Zn-ribbon protein involved in translation (DUF1610 family)
LYKGYETDESVDLGKIKILNHSSVSQKVRLKVWIDPEYRYPSVEYWISLIRRAAFMGDVGITKRTVHFASDLLKWKNWVAGVDYAEFGMLHKDLKGPKDIQAMIDKMNPELIPYGLTILEGSLVPIQAKAVRREGEYALFEIVTGRGMQDVKNALKKWHESEYVEIAIREDVYRAGVQSIMVNAKDFVRDVWLIKDGPLLKLKMLIKGKPNPFDVYRGLFGGGLLEAYKEIPVKIEIFVPQDFDSADFFRPVCESCGENIPVNYFDHPFHPEYCPKCDDEHMGRLIVSG